MPSNCSSKRQSTPWAERKYDCKQSNKAKVEDRLPQLMAMSVLYQPEKYQRCFDTCKAACDIAYSRLGSKTPWYMYIVPYNMYNVSGETLGLYGW